MATTLSEEEEEENVCVRPTTLKFANYRRKLISIYKTHTHTVARKDDLTLSSSTWWSWSPDGGQHCTLPDHA